MKKIILGAFFYCIAISAFSQKINGQWHGYFNSNGDIGLFSADNTEYVLELEIKGTKVEGFSYSYFQGRRYYVICKLGGTYYPGSKSIKVIETERVKGNTPADFQDCFQIHYLTYEKKDKQEEELVGRWITKPGQPGSGCGNGITTLVRRTLNKSISQFNKPVTKPPVAKKTAPKTNNTIAKAAPKKPAPKTNPPIAKTTPAPKVKTPVTKVPEKPIAKKTPPVAKVVPEVITKDPDNTEKPEIKKVDIAPVKTDVNFEKRKTDILKTIQVENESFRVDLYDNGEVDGDSISLFYNGRLILSHKRLSEKPITLTLNTPGGDDINELTMYAENLGEIAPNTALMVVTDGDKRYEVRIASDLKNSGTIRFIHKPKTPQ